MILTEERKALFKQNLRSIVEDGIKDANLSARAVSESVVGHDGLVRDIKAGRIPSADRIDALCTALGLEFYIGPPRDDLPDPTAAINGEEYSPIDVMGAEASAGPGRFVPDCEDAIGSMAFRKEWLKREGINPSRAMILKVKGDSMAPTLADGAVALVDQQQKNAEHPGIYAFQEEGDLRIKRLHLVQKRVLNVISDNPNFPPEARIGGEMNGLRIVGRVRWTGRMLDP